MEAAQLAEDLKVQLEHTQAKLKEIQVSVAENRTARERESSNLKRAQVRYISSFSFFKTTLFRAGGQGWFIATTPSGVDACRAKTKWGRGFSGESTHQTTMTFVSYLASCIAYHCCGEQ